MQALRKRISYLYLLEDQFRSFEQELLGPNTLSEEEVKLLQPWVRNTLSGLQRILQELQVQLLVRESASEWD